MDQKALDFMKVRAEHISKIIDLMPESEDELNKIFNDVSHCAHTGLGAATRLWATEKTRR